MALAQHYGCPLCQRKDSIENLPVTGDHDETQTLVLSDSPVIQADSPVRYYHSSPRFEPFASGISFQRRHMPVVDIVVRATSSVPVCCL
jgi:hypothetical protein